MHTETFQDIFQGVGLTIAVQLLLVGIVLIVERDQKSTFLGVFAIFLSIYPLKILLYQFSEKTIFGTLIFSGGTFFFYGPILFLYIKTQVERLSYADILKNLAAPFSLYAAYIIVRLTKSTTTVLLTNVNLMAILFTLMIAVLYLIKGRELLNHQYNYQLRKPYLVRFKHFYYLINSFLILQFSSALLLHLSKNLEWAFVEWSVRWFAVPYAEYVNMPLYLGLCLIFIVYALANSQKFKSIQLGKSILQNPDIVAGKPLIKERLNKVLFIQKVYTRPDLKLAVLANNVGVEPEVLREYIQDEYQVSYNGLMNQLRVEEFKRLVRDQNYANLTYHGISQLAGFNSKATFYRAFKEISGISPGEYLRKQDRST